MEELDDVINVPREKLWAQTMLFACDVTNKSVTTSTDGGKSPYELWFGKFPTADHLRPFGAVEYARRSVREHKMAPRGEKCVFMRSSRQLPHWHGKRATRKDKKGRGKAARAVDRQA